MADFHVFTDTEELSYSAARLFAELAESAIALRGRFTVALSGGSTPRRMFEILAKSPFKDEISWEDIVFFWGDDRAVGPEHDWSNYRLATESLLDFVPVRAGNVLRVRGELAVEQAANVMENDLVDIFGDEGLPRFDLVLLGMGNDGHTASLFPGSKALKDEGRVVAVIDPPADPRVDRVTLSLPVLNNARVALFLAAGKSKRQLIREIMTDPRAADRYPAARIEAEQTIWFVDEDAFGENMNQGE